MGFTKKIVFRLIVFLALLNHCSSTVQPLFNCPSDVHDNCKCNFTSINCHTSSAEIEISRGYEGIFNEPIIARRGYINIDCKGDDDSTIYELLPNLNGTTIEETLVMNGCHSRTVNGSIIEKIVNKLHLQETEKFAFFDNRSMDISSEFLFGLRMFQRALILTVEIHLLNDWSSSLGNISILELASQKISLPATVSRLSNSSQLKLLKIVAYAMSANYRKELKDLLTNVQHLEELFIASPAIQSLLDDTFVTLLNLRELSLTATLLEELPAQIFRNQVEMRILRLDDNRLRELPAELFGRMKNLIVLNLAFNELQIIPDKLFENLCQLRKLNLNDNKIKTIHPNAFVNLVRLGGLYLENNELNSSSFPLNSSCRNLKMLMTLQLSNNSIENYFHCWDHYESKIRFIDLSFNKISIVDPRIFDLVWHADRTIDLSNNSVRTFKENPEYDLHFETLMNNKFSNHEMRQLNIRLEGNPLECDCNFVKFTQKYREKFDYINMACSDGTSIDKKVDACYALSRTNQNSNDQISMANLS